MPPYFLTQLTLRFGFITAKCFKLYVAKRLEEGNDGEIAKQLKSFDAGFRTVIHSRILQFFQPQELMEMIIGNENYDWSVFRKVAYFNRFIRVFHSLSYI